jgi:hypothetical protein
MRLIRVVVTWLMVVLPASSLRADEGPVKALEAAEQFDLYSLNPEQRDEKEGFHGWKVLGKTTIKDAATRKQLIEAFKKSVADNKGMAAFCFIPRHGIRLTKDGKTLDLVICFQCMQVKDYVSETAGKGFLITASPQPVFDKVLMDAGVALPKGAEK